MDAQEPQPLPVWIDERGERWVEVDGAFYSIGWGDEER